MGELATRSVLRLVELLNQQSRNLARNVAVLKRQLEDLQKQLSTQSAAIEYLYSAIIQPEKQALRESRLDPAWSARTTHMLDDSTTAPPQPVLEVQLDVQPNGMGWVTIDGGWPFSLSRKLACLLFHVACADRHRVDGLPAFRSVDELKRSVSEFADSDVGNLIYRLREALAAHNWARELLQTDRRRNGCFVRLRTRRLVVSGRLPRQWLRKSPVDDSPPDEVQPGSA